MKLDLTTQDLQSLVKGSSLWYSEFNNPLVIKAGHRYSDQYNKTTWTNLDELTDIELYDLYCICKNSWK